MKEIKIVVPAVPPSRHEFNSKSWQVNWARKKAQKEKWYWLIYEQLQKMVIELNEKNYFRERKRMAFAISLIKPPYFKKKVKISLNIFYNYRKHRLRDIQNIIAGTCQIFDILGTPKHKFITAKSKPEGAKLGLIVDDDPEHLVWGKINQFPISDEGVERTEIILKEIA